MARFGNPSAISRASALYPAPLLDLPDPPAQLAIAGPLPDLSKAVAIVGTRAADAFALEFTRRLARELAQRGCAIVSGGAAGVDAAAHAGALDGGGATVAVLATGLAVPFPRTNWRLFERIVAAGGCLLCEHIDQVEGQPGRFLARNRLIAALAQVVVVTQAPYGSGALSTAAWARKLERPVLGVPHAPWDVRGQGCLEVLRLGAGICRTAADVLTLAAPAEAQSPPQNVRRPKKVEEFRGLDDDQRAVVRALRRGPRDVDELCEHSQLPAPRLQRAILMLLLSKVIQEVGSGRYARADYP